MYSASQMQSEISRPKAEQPSMPPLPNQQHVPKTSSAYAENGTSKPHPTTTPPVSNSTNTYHKRGNISASEKRAYIAAVQCITKAPSKLSTVYPGAKTRFDDFVAIHMKNTLSIHGTGNFLSWHRYYTFAYENALRVECGYNGAQPYWDWGRWAASPETSPVFDGTDTSMSGQGEKVQHGSNGLKPAGNGGGCIASGPFKGMMVNLGYVLFFCLFVLVSHHTCT
jgi:hypothetical protein